MRMTAMAMLAAALVGCSAPAATEEGAAMQKPIMGWGDLLNRPQPKPDASLSYGADALQVVDVWVPTGDGPFPAVIMIHG
ncbi:MAG: alpha/beta hydrolase, partial [Sphingopyxis sp.]